MVRSPQDGHIEFLALNNKRHASALHSLQKAAYLIEANLINYDQIPPLVEGLEDLINCDETFIGFFENDRLLGALSYKKMGNTFDIHRLVVDPAHFRKGIAQQLLNQLDTMKSDADRLIVSTAAANAPAITFYIKNGFIKQRSEVLPNGLKLETFEKI